MRIDSDKVAKPTAIFLFFLEAGEGKGERLLNLWQIAGTLPESALHVSIFKCRRQKILNGLNSAVGKLNASMVHQFECKERRKFWAFLGDFP